MIKNDALEHIVHESLIRGNFSFKTFNFRRFQYFGVGSIYFRVKLIDVSYFTFQSSENFLSRDSNKNSRDESSL